MKPRQLGIPEVIEPTADPEGAAAQIPHGGPRRFTAVVSLANSHTGGGVFFPALGGPILHPKKYHWTWWRNSGPAARHTALAVESGRRLVLVLFVRERPYVE